MAYSPIRVLPEPVGAQTTTDFPAFRAAIACFWNSSNSNGNKVFRASSWLFWVEYDTKIYFIDFTKVMW